MKSAKAELWRSNARFARVERKARRLGYAIAVDTAPNMRAPITHMAFACLATNWPSIGRFLCYSTSELQAAEAGLEILRGVVKRGDPWPVAVQPVAGRASVLISLA
jgi:hypothetical protein